MTTFWRTLNRQKYLGVNIHNKSTLITHINQVVKTVNNTRAFLQRNIYNCTRETKELCYKTLVSPQMEYTSIIWDPHTARHTHSLEMAQRRAAMFETGDFHRSSSVNNMLNELQCPTLQEKGAEIDHDVPNSQQFCCHTYSVPYSQCDNSTRSKPSIPSTISKDG